MYYIIYNNAYTPCGRCQTVEWESLRPIMISFAFLKGLIFPLIGKGKGVVNNISKLKQSKLEYVSISLSF